MAVTELIIGPGSDADREWAAQLMVASDPWVTLGRTIERCRAFCSEPEYEFFVARAEGRPLGFLLLDPRGAMNSPYVAIVAVAPEARGRRVGSRLMAFAEERCRHRARHIFLCVSSFNSRARRLYERLGYQVVAELKDYAMEGASEFLMHKRLS